MANVITTLSKKLSGKIIPLDEFGEETDYKIGTVSYTTSDAAIVEVIEGVDEKTFSIVPHKKGTATGKVILSGEDGKDVSQEFSIEVKSNPLVGVKVVFF